MYIPEASKRTPRIAAAKLRPDYKQKNGANEQFLTFTSAEGEVFYTVLFPDRDAGTGKRQRKTHRNKPFG